MLIDREYIIDYEQLWQSMLKCQRNVRWKPSVKRFVINAPEEVVRMHDELASGKWRNGVPKPIQITYPKKREALSILFRDRVYQRSINDNYLYPTMTKHFIYDNVACQKGKGPSFARRRVKELLWNFYCNSGSNYHSVNGYVLQLDIKGYYPNMKHDEVNKCFKKNVDPEIYEMIVDILENQYSGSVGYNPGSQMVQIAGISLLNPLDHYIKEKLHIKWFIRYNDDFLIFHGSRLYLEEVLKNISQSLSDLGFSINAKKTTIKPLSKGFTFLGFCYRILKSGKVIMTLKSENVHHERKKLYRMVQKCKRGEMSKFTVEQSFDSWKRHAEQGNSWKLIQRMEKYYASLWRD